MTYPDGDFATWLHAVAMVSVILAGVVEWFLARRAEK